MVECIMQATLGGTVREKHLQKIIRLCKLCKRFLQTLSQEYIHSTFMTFNQEATKITSQNKEIIM